MTANLDAQLERAAERVARDSVIPILMRRRGAPVVDARYVRVRLPGEAEPAALSQEELAALLILAGRGEVALGWPFVPGLSEGGARMAVVSRETLAAIHGLMNGMPNRP